jgi:hypothetical protein
MYGSQHNVIPREQIEQWLPELLSQDWNKEPMIGFATVMMCRKTGDRLFDISDDYREQVCQKLVSSKVPDSWLPLVQEITELSDTDSRKVFGDSLPQGLHLVG